MSAAVVLAGSTTVAAAGTSSADSPKQAAVAEATPYGSFTLTGEKARDFTLPAHMKKEHTQTFADGRTSTRYQQTVRNATVFGGQITVIRDADGTNQTVIGAYFPDLQPKIAPTLSKDAARGLVTKDIGKRGDFSTELRIDPRTDLFFYQVESIRPQSRPVRWIDAATGETVKAFNALAHGEGIGVKGDEKSFSTTENDGVFELLSQDDRQITLDAENTGQNGVPFSYHLMTDADDVWDLLGNTSPAQPAGVDAHYYANVVDDFYADTFGRNSIDDEGMQILSLVHFGQNYCNAFWNGAYMTYGDGNGTTCKSLSGGLDVDGHELTHGVTDFSSDLIYENESGALNEAFSDMMGNTIEFYAEENGLDPAAEPDWLIGEDVINTPGDATPGFRNMADPGQDGDPDHVVDQYTGEEDGGGVHTNSGIANHAYYLTVEGGQNRGCTPGFDRPEPTHTEDCDVVVAPVGLDRAAQVYYESFTGLTEYANFCDARAATIAVAKTSSRGLDQARDFKQFAAAWDAVGVHQGCEGGTPPPPPCESNDAATIPFESPHPYGNMGDCTWTYDNGTAGFAFHFSLLNTEAGYDYVYVKDANGTVLATYDGDHPNGETSPCITTSTGSVQLVTDQAVTAPGFIVDAVEPC
jgi:Zn-dependent metalloprotease